jgi:predicted O-linked N-acetylglucosamine transferase (SPINDLY family)
VFDVWMRILRQTSDSVLWLLADTPRCADHLRAAASARSIAPERLVFALRLPKAEHLARHRLADVFLDTFIVNAHTTASDALWAGLPVVTCGGVNFQSRVCTSLLSALGLQKWVARDQQEYQKLAVALAHDPSRLRDFKAQLTEHRATHPLFMTERFVRQFEQSLMALWMQRAGQSDIL